MGELLEVSGMVVADGRHTKLFVNGGGCWQLDVPFRYRKLPDGRARVRGTRSGFNRIDVETIEQL